MATPTVSSLQTSTAMPPTKAYDGVGAGNYLIAVIVLYSLGSFMALGWSMVSTKLTDKENRQVKRIVTNLRLIKTEEERWKAMERKEVVKARLRELEMIKKANIAASSVMEEMNLPESVALSIFMDETSFITSCESRNGARISFSDKLPLVDHDTNSPHAYDNVGFLPEQSLIPITPNDTNHTVVEMHPQAEMKDDLYHLEVPLPYCGKWNNSDDNQSVISTESLLHEADNNDNTVLSSSLVDHDTNTPHAYVNMGFLPKQSLIPISPNDANHTLLEMHPPNDTNHKVLEMHTPNDTNHTVLEMHPQSELKDDLYHLEDSLQYCEKWNNSDDNQSMISTESLLHEADIHDDDAGLSSATNNFAQIGLEIRARSSIDNGQSAGQFCDSRKTVSAESEIPDKRMAKTSCSSINNDFRRNSETTVMSAAIDQSCVATELGSHSATNEPHSNSCFQTIQVVDHVTKDLISPTLFGGDDAHSVLTDFHRS